VFLETESGLSPSRSVIVVAALAAGLWPSAGSAQGMENTRSVTLSAGTGLALGGNVITEAVGSINGTPAVFVEQGYGNHFSDALGIRVTGNLGLDFNKEAFVTFAYNKMNATERVTGSVGGYPLYTRFNNTFAFDLEGGLRYYFLPEGPTRTYAAGVIGLRFLQSTDVTVNVRELGLTFADVPYFEGSTLFILGGDAGISRDLSDKFAIGAEIGLRFHGKPGAEELFADPNLAPVNDTGSRWSIPISGFVTVRF
jgi:hypothetical protein